MILGDAEEIITSVEIDDETYEEIVRVTICFACSAFTLFLLGKLEPRRQLGAVIVVDLQTKMRTQKHCLCFSYCIVREVLNNKKFLRHS